MNTSEGATRAEGAARTDVAPTTITLPPWLMRGWARVTSDPVAVMSWLFAIVGILAVSTEIVAPPLGKGWRRWLSRGLVAWSAGLYLRLAGVDARY